MPLTRLPHLFSVLFTVITIILSDKPSSADSADRDIVVMFRPGVVQIPAGSTGCTLDEATISTVSLENILYSIVPDSIVLAAPTFDRADTLRIGSEGQAVPSLDWSLVHRLLMPAGSNRDSLCTVLSQSPDVVFAEPSVAATFHGPAYPNDSLFVSDYQWGLWNKGQLVYGQPGTANADIDAPWAWGKTQGDDTVEIGIIDSGVNSNHEEFPAARFSQYTDPSTDPANPHGFWVAGVAAAARNNNRGIAGMDGAARLISGRSDISTTETANAINNCSPDARVLNMSWSLETHSGEPLYSIAVASALATAYFYNDVSVVSMGNTGNERINFPAAFGHGTIAVGATNNLDNRWMDSTTGPHIDVVAPGVGIWTTSSGSSYTQVDGTSVAAPAVAGIAALVKTADQTLTNDDIRWIIRLSAKDISPVGWDSATGSGRVNARRALEIFRPPNIFARGISGPEANPQSIGNTGPTKRRWQLLIGMSPPTYWVIRHDVRGYVSFGSSFSAPPNVWGRGLLTNGAAIGIGSQANPDTLSFGLQWCDVVPGTVTASGCSLRTYVYQTWELDAPNGTSAWWPCSPSEVRFAWSALEVKSYPDTTNSYYVPQVVVGGNLKEGHDATKYFHTCPNLDTTQSLPHNSRVKVVVKDASGNGIPGISTADIFVLLNGGTRAQGFIGEGADSVIADSTYNALSHCPVLRTIPADSPTDAFGTTYITFIGVGGQRDSTRKWGSRDSELPVYVLGTKLQGRAKTDSTNGSYVLRIRNLDYWGGWTTATNQGEVVNNLDLAPLQARIPNGPYEYFLDFDENGDLDSGDLSYMKAHINHRCNSPLVH